MFCGILVLITAVFDIIRTYHAQHYLLLMIYCILAVYLSSSTGFRQLVHLWRQNIHSKRGIPYGVFIRVFQPSFCVWQTSLKKAYVIIQFTQTASAWQVGPRSGQIGEEMLFYCTVQSWLPLERAACPLRLEKNSEQEEENDWSCSFVILTDRRWLPPYREDDPNAIYYVFWNNSLDVSQSRRIFGPNKLCAYVHLHTATCRYIPAIAFSLNFKFSST